MGQFTYVQVHDSPERSVISRGRLTSEEFDRREKVKRDARAQAAAVKEEKRAALALERQRLSEWKAQARDLRAKDAADRREADRQKRESVRNAREEQRAKDRAAAVELRAVQLAERMKAAAEKMKRDELIRKDREQKAAAREFKASLPKGFQMGVNPHGQFVAISPQSILTPADIAQGLEPLPVFNL